MEPWQRQHGESRQAFAAFSAYRGMGPTRSTAKVAQELGKSKSLMDRWSARWQWTKRADAWDDELDRQARQTEIEETRAMMRRHVQASMAVQHLALARLQEMQNPKNSHLTNDQVLRYLSEGIRIERLSRGEPGAILEEASDRPVDPVQVEFEKVDRIKHTAAVIHELRAMGRLPGVSDGGDSRPDILGADAVGG